jgi:hypothetical protein
MLQLAEQLQEGQAKELQLFQQLNEVHVRRCHCWQKEKKKLGG